MEHSGFARLVVIFCEFFRHDKAMLAKLGLVHRDWNRIVLAYQFADVTFDFSECSMALLERLWKARPPSVPNDRALPMIGPLIRSIRVHPTPQTIEDSFTKQAGDMLLDMRRNRPADGDWGMYNHWKPRGITTQTVADRVKDKQYLTRFRDVFLGVLAGCVPNLRVFESSDPLCYSAAEAGESMMDIAGRSPRPHRNLIGCQRNQGPRTRTSLLRHQLSRRKPSPVHKAFEDWAAWKMLPHRHRTDVPRTSPGILEPSGDSASGCIAPKPSPDPVLTPSYGKFTGGERASRIRMRGIGTLRPRAFVRGSGGTLVGTRGSRCKQAGKRPQKTDMELTRYLHADIHHASAPAASAHWAASLKLSIQPSP